MTRWVLAAAAAEDLERLVEFLLERFPEDAVKTVDVITDALTILQHHPRIGRPLEAALRELVISRGRTGYLALYEYDEVADLVIVLAVRHQREQDYP
jgi:plasmid stabilization system protein ParE